MKTWLVHFFPLILSGCAEVARVAVQVPLFEEAPGESPRTVLTLADPQCCCPNLRREEELRSLLMHRLTETGRFRVYEGLRLECSIWTSHSARWYGRSYEADLILLFRLGHFDLRLNQHHLHDYFDGEAGAKASLIVAATGEVLREARQQTHLSTRARYSTRPAVEELLLARLGDQLARDLLYRDTGQLVELDDPANGSQREGIEFAKRGEWRKAIAAWGKTTSAGDSQAAGRRNIAVALRILGGKGMDV